MESLALEPQAAAAHLAALDRLTSPKHSSTSSSRPSEPAAGETILTPVRHDVEGVSSASAWPTRVLTRAEAELTAYVEGGTAQGLSQQPDSWAPATMGPAKLPNSMASEVHEGAAAAAAAAADRQRLVCSLYIAGEVRPAANFYQPDACGGCLQWNHEMMGMRAQQKHHMNRKANDLTASRFSAECVAYCSQDLAQIHQIKDPLSPV